ncbi:MAG TPA: DUF5706 domain-containing protein [Chitinophagaceae bacterium]|nr:DUF5706 domain-containing protein [Chitinophagaceae bacterium]
MGENDSLLLKDAEAYVTDLFVTKVSKSVMFHTIEHTKEVVAACEKMSEYYSIPDDDRVALLLAAWFHDTGYSSGQSHDHESVSINLAKDFLAAHNAPPVLVAKVTGCINATRMPQNPGSTIEMILCDADLFHLGTGSFREKSKLLRKELKEFGNEELSKGEWKQNNIAFLEAHKYFTSYGQENLQPEKEKNLEKLKTKKPDMGKPDKKNKDKKPIIPEADSKAKKDKDKDNKTERGISTVFRIMAQTQNNLSQMADSKANILISVNSIILSIIISTLFEKLATDTYLRVPVAILVVVCVTTVIFGILATRPNVSGGTFTAEDIHNKKTNLLFFGNFHKMTLTDYDWAMQEMLNDKDYLYSSIVKDNYFLGVVLAKKYRYLRIAYNIFMFGLIIAIIAFAIFISIPTASDTYLPG